MKNKSLYLVVVLSIGVILLAACGGASDSTSNEFTVKVVDEFGFEPNTITVKAGETITVTFENSGTVEHNLNFIKPDAEIDHLLEEIEEGAGEHIDEELLTDMHDIEPGHTESVTFVAPSEPGEYTFLCTTVGHAEAGQVGTFIVVP